MSSTIGANTETLKMNSENNQQRVLSPLEAMGHQGIAVEAIPTFDSMASQRKWLLEHLAGAFRVFGREGYAEGIAGHISVRDPEFPDRFWINPLAVHFSMMRVSDLICLDMQGNVVAGNTAWAAFGRPLDMLSQDVCYFYKAHSVYDNFGGIAFAADEGTNIAHALGDNKAAILVNHGLITVGQTVDEAAYLYTLLEKSCRIQLMVESTGLPKRIVPEEEASNTFRMASTPDTLFVEFQPSYKLEEHLDPSFKN
ncbi:hypothetical protein ACEQ8H_004126 [Pleosporales sp. CAS-2024a]